MNLVDQLRASKTVIIRLQKNSQQLKASLRNQTEETAKKESECVALKARILELEETISKERAEFKRLLKEAKAPKTSRAKRARPKKEAPVNES